MKKIILCSVILFIACFVSCKKSNDEDKNTVAKNEYRVKRIEGKNEMWGEYQLLFYYSNEKLDSVWRCDLNGDILKRDTLGSFSFSYKKESSISISDRVLNIDADSVERLKIEFPNSYLDSLRHRRGSLNLYYKKFDPAKSTETYNRYTPREDVGVGKDFNNKYLNVLEKRNLFEYNNEGKIVVIREFYKTYNPNVDENDQFETEIYKYTIDYNGEHVAVVKYFVQDSHNDASWNELDHYRLNYENNKLLSIDGKRYNMSRSGDKITVNENGEITVYTLDSNGNAVSVIYPDGSYAKMEYEKGAGNYASVIYPQIDYLLGKSIIK